MIIKTHSLSPRVTHACALALAFAGLSSLAACVTDTTTGSSSPPAGGSGGLSGVAGAAAGGAAPLGSAGSVNVAGAPNTAGADGNAGSSATAGAAGSSGAAGSGGSSGAAGSGGSSGAVGSGGSSGDTTDPGTDGDGMRTLNKPAAAPEISQMSGVPHGAKFKFTLAAGSSKIYPGAVAREINVYVPTQYVKGTPAPVIVVQDGNNFFGFVNLVSNTLDNLIGANKLPPIIAVFANNGGGDAQGSERGKEYDTLSGVYAEWVDQELLPRVEQQSATSLPAQAVTFTKDPEGRGSLGGSSGGIAAFTMAWYHPDLFRRVIGYSPSFVAQESPINPDHPLGGWNYHEDMDNDPGGIIAKTDPVKPVRAWLECGTNDDGAGTASDPNTQYPHYDFYFAVTRTWTKLTGKGYHTHVDVGTGAGHVDQGMVNATLPTAILWAWRGYKGGQ